MTSFPIEPWAGWYEDEFRQKAVVLLDERFPEDAIDEEVDIRLTPSLTVMRWISRPVREAPRLLALAAGDIRAALLHLGVDSMTGDVYLGAPQLPIMGPPPAERVIALGIPFKPVPAGADHRAEVAVPQDSLASVLEFAVVPEGEAPNKEAERPEAPDPADLPLDIYSSKFIALARRFGAPLETVWHVNWELSGVRWCLLNGDLDVEDTARIPYRQALAGDDFVSALQACTDAGLRSVELPVFVIIGPGSGHVIHVERIDGQDVVYHDPWPGRSMLAAGNNALGIAARPYEGRRAYWWVTRSELQRAAYATLLEPASWLSICGVLTEISYPDLTRSDFFEFFHIREIGRSAAEQDGLVLIGLQPGNWQELINLTATVDTDDLVRDAMIMVSRDWLVDQATARFAFDLLSHWIGAFVTDVDTDEASLLRAALRAMPRGELADAVAAGPPHLLNQFRLFAMTVAGAVPFGRVTLPCSTLRAFNVTMPESDEAHVILTACRPKYDRGTLAEDQESGYLMDDYRMYLWNLAQTAARNIATLGHT